MSTALPPLSDSIITAVSRLLDDRDNPRDPSHSDIRSHVQRAGLIAVDPANPVEKEKRVRAILGRAIENDEVAGRRFVQYVIAEIRGCGGFRPVSNNDVGADPIENARAAFREEGFDLSLDGLLRIIADARWHAEMLYQRGNDDNPDRTLHYLAEPK